MTVRTGWEISRDQGQIYLSFEAKCVWFLHKIVHKRYRPGAKNFGKLQKMPLVVTLIPQPAFERYGVAILIATMRPVCFSHHKALLCTT